LACDLLLELCTFLLEFKPCLLELLVSRSQVLLPHVRKSPRASIIIIIVVVVRQVSPSLVDALDVPLGGLHHEALPRGVMAFPAGIRVKEGL